jgi:activating signal cointegrator complex subunit 3
MQLTKTEMEETQIIVTTPEKLDVVTRKTSDSPLTKMIRLIIVDEVHLLNEDRGKTIEVLIARTLRQVETSQSMIRIVGLSATLPNYKDVAQFMRVNESTGLHYFDGSYRPVPLEQTFIGVKGKGFQAQRKTMTEVCFDSVVETLKKGKQCMVFVHARKETTKTCQDLLALAEDKGMAELFSDEVMNGKSADWARKEISKSRNQDVKRLFLAGFACHHAGMLRSDRNLVEKMFHQGLIKVLCCTATLAWGINMPASKVIIKGTQVYNAEKGKFVSVSMLDVMQIFGRAGRPQYDGEGSAVMLTTHDELYRYLALTAHQAPIESQFTKGLVDNLNAEIVLGTVTSIQEAVAWLSYTYMYVRMLKNPMVYGISYEERELDKNLVNKRTELIVAAATELDNTRMIRFNNPYFASTNLGQTASHYYISHETIGRFNEAFEKKSNNISISDVIQLICTASEFENVVSREEELGELDKLKNKACPVDIKGDPSGDKTVKVNILLQAYVSRASISQFALVCDTNYVSQNAARICRGLFEIALRKGLPDAASLLLKLCKMIDLRQWDSLHPLRQFPQLKESLVAKLEQRGLTVDRLLDMDAGEIGSITRVPAATANILACVRKIPYLEIETTVQPITRTIIRVRVTLRPDFKWDDRLHGAVQPFWLWLEHPGEISILHQEYILLRKKEAKQPSEIVFTVPITHPVPPQYMLHVVSDRWLGSDNSCAISFKKLILPQLYPPHTTLLDLQPLSRKALNNEEFESIFKYEYFNPIQTQIFHTLYHTDQNVLLGAPTGSGKTVAGELACLRLMKESPHLKTVYLGPLKALVQERLKDWRNKFGKMKKNVIEMTGEYTPDIMALKQADIICTTPEKFDGVSRSWQNRSYVKQVGLIIIDEIHLLGEDRGPILEVIVSRMRYIAAQTNSQCRIVGLSTALANAQDLGDWLGIDGPGLFNFHPSVRPVPLKVHVMGFEGKAYCPRMQTMNRPCYKAILSYSPHKPVLIFVSSRRQTRLTALDVISHVAADGQPKRFVTGDEDYLKQRIEKIRDATLKHTLSFGIGLHHAGISRDDRRIVEELFADCVIQVLVATATLAWGVNMPAHLCIVKGAVFYDAPTRQYKDYAITDILQMMGRAGRPQFDDSAEAVVMCKTDMKGFYKKFLYEPFPVESSLQDVLHEHLNAEIVSGSITTKHDAINYLTFTYLYRRILKNPTYYGLEDAENLENVNKFLSLLVDDCLRDLEAAHCVEIDEEDETTIWPLQMAKIISYYYLSHQTARLFFEEIEEDSSPEQLLQILCDSHEYSELPVRHNEDGLNEELAKDEGIRFTVEDLWDSPHVKANLLLQAYFSRVHLPISDYITDTKSVIDQAIRILQAMVDVAADAGFLTTCLRTMHLTQAVVQAQWMSDDPLLQLPFFDKLAQAKKVGCSLKVLLTKKAQEQEKLVRKVFSDKHKVNGVMKALRSLPVLEMDLVAKKKVVKKGEVLNLEIKLRKLAGSSDNSSYCPMFKKQKNESYWLVIGDEDGELFCLKRVLSKLGKKWHSVKLEIEQPEEDEDEADLYEEVSDRTFNVYLVSDSYIGLDIEKQITIKVE